MSIAYLISIIVAYYNYEKIYKKTRERLKEDGYTKVDINDNSLIDSSYICAAFVLLIPFVNFIAPMYSNSHFDEYYKDLFNDWLKKGKIKKIEETEEELVDESSDRLKINNILAAKSMQEENIPRWKKGIANIYYQIGNMLKEHNVIVEKKDNNCDTYYYEDQEKRHRK